MFGILGIAFALILFGLSALSNLYEARKCSGKIIKVRFAKEVRTSSLVAFALDVIAFLLLTFF
jgi:hypothetical protein